MSGKLTRKNALRLKFRERYMKKRVIATQLFNSLRQEKENKNAA